MHNAMLAAGSQSEVAIGVQVASFVLDRGFSDYRLSTVSLYCRTLVAVSTSVQIHQAPSTFHPEHQVCMLVARHSWPCYSTSSCRVVHDCGRPLSAFLAD